MRTWLLAPLGAVALMAGSGSEAAAQFKIKMPKLPPVNVPKPGPFQQKLGTEIVSGAVGGAAAGALSGGVGYTFKNHAKKHWGWK